MTKLSKEDVEASADAVFQKIEKGMAKLENTCIPVDWIPANNEIGFEDKPSSVLFQFSKKDFGFGEIRFYFDAEGTLCCDNECMSKETVKSILCSMVDNAKFRD